MMMGVAFLLDRSGVVVDSQPVADQDTTEVFSENVAQELTSAALSNDIEGEQLGSENPQPPARAGDPPAGFIAMKRRCPAQFYSNGVGDRRMLLTTALVAAVLTAISNHLVAAEIPKVGILRCERSSLTLSK